VGVSDGGSTVSLLGLALLGLAGLRRRLSREPRFRKKLKSTIRSANRRFQFDKRSQHFIGLRNKTLSVTAVCFNNPYCSPFKIQSWDHEITLFVNYSSIVPKTQRAQGYDYFYRVSSPYRNYLSTMLPRAFKDLEWHKGKKHQHRRLSLLLRGLLATS
jgi:hypothetical protein